MIIKYKINLEKLNYSTINEFDYKIIMKYKDEYLELVTYVSTDDYPYELKLGYRNISFKKEEIIAINMKDN